MEPAELTAPADVPRRRPWFAVAVTAAAVVPVAVAVGVAAVLANGTAAPAPAPTVTRVVTPTPMAPEASGAPAPLVTDIPIAMPDDPLLDALTENADRQQACRFILGNINADEWGESMEKFVSLFATAKTLTAEPALTEALDALVEFSAKNGYPEDALIGETVSLCTDGVYS